MSKVYTVVHTEVQACDEGSMCDTDTRDRLRDEFQNAKIEAGSCVVRIGDVEIDVMAYVVREAS